MHPYTYVYNTTTRDQWNLKERLIDCVLGLKIKQVFDADIELMGSLFSMANTKANQKWLYLLVTIGQNKLLWHALDPHSQIWQRLPIMPSVVDEEDSQKGSSGLWMWNMVKGIRIAKIIRGLLGQKDALDDMPFCGCAFGAIDGCLYVLGWPVKQTGTKLSVVVNGELYAFDPSNYVDSGRIKVYDQGEDEWKVVIGKVPVYDFTESESPYLLAGFRGKLHFITKDANHDISVLQADHCSNVDSSPSTSAPQSPKYMEDELLRESAETNEAVWKLVASKGFEQAELINCQVIDI
ncbi:F-box/kelch-repeat protein [Glycine soja]|uniref:F-box/kelch-repeat protein n=1 Tax=Glycine soja TaxID=3848 RepID=A0A445KDW6_GLYSO|nr:F-box/kelch-repeat protein [Glycine soja]